MNNVIRPAFGRSAGSTPSTKTPLYDETQIRPLRVYGTAGTHFVGLVRVETGPGGPSLRVVVGAEGCETVNAVAVLPATPEGETDAEAMGMAVLRALDVVRRTPAPPFGE